MQSNKQDIPDISTSGDTTLELTYVKQLRTLLEKLMETTDTKRIMDAVLDALREITSFYTIAYTTFDEPDVNIQEHTIYVFSKGTLDAKYCDALTESFQVFADSLPGSVADKTKVQAVLAGRINYEMLSGTLTEQTVGVSSRPVNFFCVPFLTGKRLLGIFQIAAPTDAVDQQTYTEAQLYYAQKVIEAAALSYGRIQHLIQEGRRRVEEKAEELQKLNQFMVGRELKMAELKREINRLYGEQGKPPKYKEQES